VLLVVDEQGRAELLREVDEAQPPHRELAAGLHGGGHGEERTLDRSGHVVR